ncbi:MAG: helix-turn-helix domain-containing protein [Clostridia bacterium]|nr:helix-turn-helix domain-containing protein [Clostridia bacterium]
MKLKEIRTKCLMTQQEVAQKLNITQSTYSGYESGKYQPSIDILIAISKLFKVSIDYLLGNENEFTIDMSDLPDIKKEVLLYWLKQDEYETIQQYRNIQDKLKWEEENPEEAHKQKMNSIIEQQKEYEMYMYKIKKAEEKEKNKKG